MRLRFACEIAYTADIHPSVNFAHYALGVVVGHSAVIGENTKILQNVCIGGRRGLVDETGRSNPLIGKNVIIGVGACVLGPVKIGDNARIGANAVVLKDVPEGCTAVGIPARIIYPQAENEAQR